MADTSVDVIRTNSKNFLYKLKVIEFQIKKATKSFLLDDEVSIFYLETTAVDVSTIMVAQILTTFEEESILKPNYNVVFTDFSSFTEISLKQNEDWAIDFPDLLVCNLEKEEQLDKQYHIIKSWVDTLKDKSKKIIFIMEASRNLERSLMTIGIINIMKLKLVELRKENESVTEDESIRDIGNNEGELDEVNSEAASARALDKDTNDIILKEVSTQTLLHGEATAAGLVNLLQSFDVKDINAVDMIGNIQLHLAARDGKTQMVEYLLAHGVEKYIQNNRGETALHLAAAKGNSAIVKMLLEYGFSVHVIDDDQWTPLHYACYRQNDAHFHLIEILLTFGARIEKKNKIGQTALHWAALEAHSDAVKVLLKHGAFINSRDHYGDTPLHRATIYNKPASVAILLRNGADIKIENNYGRTALDEAKLLELYNIIQIFKTHEAMKLISMQNGS